MKISYWNIFILLLYLFYQVNYNFCFNETALLIIVLTKYFKIRMDNTKKVLWASRLWVGSLPWVWSQKSTEKSKFFTGQLTFNAQEDTGVPFHRNFNSILRRDHQTNFLWASRLWVGRRKEPILGYVPKNDEKNNLVLKGLIEF